MENHLARTREVDMRAKAVDAVLLWSSKGPINLSDSDKEVSQFWLDQFHDTISIKNEEGICDYSGLIFAVGIFGEPLNLGLDLNAFIGDLLPIV